MGGINGNRIRLGVNRTEIHSFQLKRLVYRIRRPDADSAKLPGLKIFVDRRAEIENPPM